MKAVAIAVLIFSSTFLFAQANPVQKKTFKTDLNTCREAVAMFQVISTNDAEIEKTLFDKYTELANENAQQSKELEALRLQNKNLLAAINEYVSEVLRKPVPPVQVPVYVSAPAPEPQIIKIKLEQPIAPAPAWIPPAPIIPTQVFCTTQHWPGQVTAYTTCN